MELDFAVRNYIEESLSKYGFSIIKNKTKQIIADYLNNDNQGHSYINDELSAKIYASFRMPATYKAISSSLMYIKELYDEPLTSLIDVGAGSGSVSIAVNQVFNIKDISCYEINEYMYDLGRDLTTRYIDGNISWDKLDIVKQNIDKSADIVVMAYALNEINEKERMMVIDKLWSITNKILLIVETGTPNGYQIISSVRNHLLAKSAHIIAPCVREDECPLTDDWCHFSTRVMRSKFHKLIKAAEVPYEDEKYSYIAFSKKENKKANTRVIRHPYILSSYVKLELCSPEGIKTLEVRKNNKALYKKAKKIASGDNF